MVKVVSNRLGVPYVQMANGEIVPVSPSFVGDLAAAEIEHPGVLDDCVESLKMAAWKIAGLNPNLPIEEWWTSFNEVLAINELIAPLHALREAQYKVTTMQEEYGE